MLRDILLLLSQSTIEHNSRLTTSITEDRLEPVQKKFESSAKRMENKSGDTKARSLIYNKKRRGPKFEP